MLSIICITGTDGAGKTAITDGLVQSLESRGLNVERIWSRFNNYTTKPLLAITRVTGHNHYKFIGDIHHGFHDFESLGMFRHIFAILQMIDLNIATYFKISRKVGQDTILVCERGPWDTLADVIADTDLYQLKNNFVGKMFVRQISQRSITYLISRDIGKIYQCRPELAEDYKMKKKYKIYHELAEQKKWNIIDNNGALEQSIKNITDDLLSKGVI